MADAGLGVARGSGLLSSFPLAAPFASLSVFLFLFFSLSLSACVVLLRLGLCVVIIAELVAGR